MSLLFYHFEPLKVQRRGQLLAVRHGALETTDSGVCKQMLEFSLDQPKTLHINDGGVNSNAVRRHTGAWKENPV
jgi:hypothetical protein